MAELLLQSFWSLQKMSGKKSLGAVSLSSLEEGNQQWESSCGGSVQALLHRKESATAQVLEGSLCWKEE